MTEEPAPRCRCGKLSYPTRAEAEAIVRAMAGQVSRHPRRRGRRHPYSTAALTAYRCTWIARGASGPSGAWHVGNNRGARTP